MKNQITELLTNYGPIGAIWLDGISTPRSQPEKMHLFKTQQLYDHIHALQPQVLNRTQVRSCCSTDSRKHIPITHSRMVSCGHFNVVSANGAE